MERKRPRRLAYFALILSAALAGCGGGGTVGERSPAGSRPASVAPSGPPALSSLCGNAGRGARAIFFRASDGTRLYGALLGAGTTGVVVANDVPHPLCEEVPVARQLSRRGLGVMVFDYRGHGESEAGSDPGRLDLDVVAAARQLERGGVHTVSVLGAYAGGALGLVAAATDPAIRGVVGISAAPKRGEFVGGPYSGLGAFDAGLRLRIPVLLIAVKTDQFVPIREERLLLAAIGSHAKQLVVFPFGRGGWDLFNLSPFGSRPTRLVVRFVESLGA
jgi:dienelactone hydrolase